MSPRQEMVWIDGWNELYEKLKDEPNLLFVTSDWSEITKDKAFGFIQDEAYDGYSVYYQEVRFKGKKALQYFRGAAIE